MKRRILASVLMLAQLFTVILVVPLAVSAESVSCDFVKGTYAEDTVYSTQGEIVHYDTSGSIPGMELGSTASQIKLMGTPTETGRHDMDLTIYVRDGENELTESLTIEVFVSSAAVTLNTIQKSYLVGDKVDLELNELGTGGEIFDCSYSGELPAGVKIQFFDSYVALSGQVTKSGTYTVNISAYDQFSEGWRHQSVTFVVEEPVVETVPAPIITKDPTGETVTVGGRAAFIARAEHADQIIWRLVSPDKEITYECRDAAQFFDGLMVSGTDAEKLVLDNIPLELNGWKVEAKFIGQGGSAWSKGALLTVRKAPPQPPKITVQPVDIQIEKGGSGQLTTKAESPQGKEVTYQWYFSAAGMVSDGEKIDGATDRIYYPQFREATCYYYCEIRCVEDDLVSEPVTTAVARVLWVEKTETKPPETQQPTEKTEYKVPEAQEETSAPPIKQELPAAPEKEKDGLPIWAIVVIAAVSVAAVVSATVVVTLVVVKNKNGKYTKD